MLSNSTEYTAEPAHNLLLAIPPPIIATYLSVLKSVSSLVKSGDGKRAILGVDQVSPSLL